MTSPSEEGPPAGSFGELSEAECKQLLAQHKLGASVSWLGEAHDLAGTYQYRTGSVIFRTSLMARWLGSSDEPVWRSRSMALTSRTSQAGAFWYWDSPRRWRRTTCSHRPGRRARCPGRTASEPVHRNQAAQDQRPRGQLGVPRRPTTGADDKALRLLHVRQA